eukprot:331921_1
MSTFSQLLSVIICIKVTTASWTTLSDMSRKGDQMALGVYNGKVFLIGGYDYNSQAMTYDTTTLQFTDLGQNALSGSIFGGKAQYYTQQGTIIYMIDTDGDDLNIYNMATDQFTSAWHALDSPVSSSGCLASTSSHLYVTGGDYSRQAFSHIQVFSLSTHQWLSNAPDMKAERRRGACIVENGYLWAFGGDIDTNERIQVAGIISNSWSYVDPLSETLSKIRCASWSNTIYIIGGENDLYEAKTYVHVMDAITGSIRQLSDDMPAINKWSSPIVIGDILYVFGGFYPGDTLMNYYAYYTLATINPTKQATNNPTNRPTPNPTRRPTANPFKRPTNEPTVSPTRKPTSNPTRRPTTNPTRRPTPNPTRRPTANPFKRPTNEPTVSPTRKPTSNPTRRPTLNPTKQPTPNPTLSPTPNPTKQPTINPSKSPTTPSPTVPGAFRCGQSDVVGEYNGQALEFTVLMTLPGDIVFDMSYSKFTITVMEAFNSDNQLIETDYDDNQIIHLNDVPSGTYKFKIYANQKTSLMYDVRTTCTTHSPTPAPTNTPSDGPTPTPTFSPTDSPTDGTDTPSDAPTASPIYEPTSSPTTAFPTTPPINNPTSNPTLSTMFPTLYPTLTPTDPSVAPTTPHTLLTDNPTRTATTAAVTIDENQNQDDDGSKDAGSVFGSWLVPVLVLLSFIICGILCVGVVIWKRYKALAVEDDHAVVRISSNGAQHRAHDLIQMKRYEQANVKPQFMINQAILASAIHKNKGPALQGGIVRIVEGNDEEMQVTEEGHAIAKDQYEHENTENIPADDFVVEPDATVGETPRKMRQQNVQHKAYGTQGGYGGCDVDVIRMKSTNETQGADDQVIYGDDYDEYDVDYIIENS